jgi:hypothetical protein
MGVSQSLIPKMVQPPFAILQNVADRSTYYILFTSKKLWLPTQRGAMAQKPPPPLPKYATEYALIKRR